MFWSLYDLRSVVQNNKEMMISKMADMMFPTNRRPVNLSALKQKALMNILETELIAVNYKLCSHCGPTKEDIPAPQSDVITKVRHTPPCAIHPWQPALTDDLRLVKKKEKLPLLCPWARDTPTRPLPCKLSPILDNSVHTPVACHSKAIGPLGC